jgi:hypothetical protein
VARYYFDIHNGAQSVRDDGAEFDSQEAAVQAATRSAAEIGTGRLARAIPALWSSRFGMRAASGSAPSKRRWRSSGTSHGHRGRTPGAHKCRSQHRQKRTRHGAGLCLGDGHEHQHVGSPTLTPMGPFQYCHASGGFLQLIAAAAAASGEVPDGYGDDDDQQDDPPVIRKTTACCGSIPGRGRTRRRARCRGGGCWSLRPGRRDSQESKADQCREFAHNCVSG